MEEELLNTLRGSEALTAIVGSRIRPVDRPQTDSLPSITFQRVDGIRYYTHSGANNLVNSRIQIDCWGKTYQETKNTARAVVQALNGITEPFQGSFILDESDTSEDADTSRIFRTRLDIQLFHKEF
ncbi:DUF3168 domain-containing protein [Aureimonas altamirensis]|uniref:DUF3168 domain-containing protein n=1 Tax=Aureimonas altamirensis TaxID=370622 RepID=UPI0020371EBC|nr:DUF3168 domain-containing protein [Aureimonas altamirensis]MCM2506066.1 DUF3168 domain-containing protein [Aureimonas altamirensis]